MPRTRARRSLLSACAALLLCAAAVGGAAQPATPATGSAATPAAGSSATPSAASSAAPAAASPGASAAARAQRARKEAPALFGMGAQPCQAFVDVAPEADNRQIAISGAMFSWAQGWFSARNVIGHLNAPHIVGGSLSSEKLKAMLVMECRTHSDESLFLAVDDLYDRLAREGR